MKAIRLATALLLICWGLVVWGGGGASAENPKAEIVGAAKCGVCHKTASRGNQTEIWQNSGHARAYETLASEAAKARAKKKGFEDPQKEAKCLGCHTTAGFLGGEVKVSENGKYTVEEGVSCETCHGAGSNYQKMKIMKDPEAAKVNGLLKPDEEFCLKCHNENEECAKEFVFKDRWAKIAHPVPKD